MSGTGRSSRLPPAGTARTVTAYRRGDPIWIHRTGAWRPGVVLNLSDTAVTVRYRVTGAEGTGVDTVVLGRPELAPRADRRPPPEPVRTARAARPATVPGPSNGRTMTPSCRPERDPPRRPQRQPAGRLRPQPAGRPAPPASGPVVDRRVSDGVIELRVLVRSPGDRPAELPLRCAVDRRTGTVALRLPDGRTGQFDLTLARAASMILHEAVLACLDPQELRLWIQR
ncbi:hypothetical protein [Micromonospora sp. LOL_021]|uniref:hypothetical protein n=1 Tax=Micromonospora sp. LOL_021 TaxID=3345417 RepID=UPI003A837AEF